MFGHDQGNSPTLRQLARGLASWVGDVQVDEVKWRGIFVSMGLRGLEQRSCYMPYHGFVCSEVDDAFCVRATFSGGIERDRLSGRHPSSEPDFTAVPGGNRLNVALDEVAQGLMDLAGVPASEVQHTQSMGRIPDHEFQRSAGND